jgi:cytochrome P450
VRLQFALDPIAHLDRLADGGHGDLVAFSRGMGGGILRPGTQSPGAVFAVGAAHNQAVLSRHGLYHPLLLESPPGARGLQRLYSGILWMHGDKHKQQRRLMTPAFHPRRLEAYRDLLVASTEKVLAGWRGSDTVDVLDQGRQMLLGFLNQILIGDDDTPGAVSIGARMEDLTRRAMSIGGLLPIDLPFTPRRELIQRADRLADDLATLIRKKRAAAASRDDLLSTLIAARDEDGSSMTEDELIGQLFLLFFAGFESSMSVLAWTSYLLAQHPAIAADLHDELSVLGGAAPTLAQLEQLPVLDGVIKESLRLCPPVYILTRTLADRGHLGGYDLPARTEIFLSLYHTHRRADVFPDPLRFRPERWRSISPGNHAYLPFGAGAHMCLGWGLATMELKLMLSMIVQRYRLGLRDGTTIDRRTLAVMSPRHGVRMTVQPQDRRFTASRGDVRGHFTTMVELDRP